MKLDYIAFNLDPNKSTDNALNVRQNYTKAAPHPAWNSRMRMPQQSRIVYARDLVGNNPIKINVFLTVPLSIRDFYIKASPSSYILGEVPVTHVPYYRSPRRSVDIELKSRLSWNGIAKQDFSWNWQYSFDGKSWRDMRSTQHRVFIVLDTPNAPWSQNLSDRHFWPWLDALEWACHWASGASDKVQASTAITKQIFDLGDGSMPLLKYDCDGHGSSHFVTHNIFDATSFLDVLRNKVTSYLNCTDLACMVSTMSNLLGAKLYQSRMGYNFDLNPVLSIGCGNTWQTPCGWNGFFYHEVAWVDPCDQNQPVYDANVILNNNNPPTKVPGTRLWATNIPFGRPGKEYRYRLASVAGQNDCKPQPQTRQIRKIK